MLTETVLAIDASGEGCSVALWHNEALVQRSSGEARKHAQSLLPMIDAVLLEAGIALNKVATIALINGPGSFTGIRIAVSVVQGLAYGAGIPVVALSSLHVLAHMAAEAVPMSLLSDDLAAHKALPSESLNATIVCALDARMSEVYWSAYSFADGQLRCIETAQVSPFEHFNKAVGRLYSEAQTTFSVGSGFSLDTVVQPTKSVVGDVDSTLQPAASAMISLLLSFDEIESLKQNVVQLEPLYLRNEVAWQKRTRIRTERPF